MTIRTAVIGYGLGGMAFHAPLIHAVPELELAAIATSRADDVHARYPGVMVTGVEAVIADPSIELVAISTPNDTHVPLARAALAAGKHVVLDKPFAPTLAEGEMLDALANSRGLVLTAFHNRRWDGDFLTVRDLIAGGVLGAVMLAEFRWDRFRPEVTTGWKDGPQAGSGILGDLGSHMIDQTLQLFGLPHALSADLQVQREGASTLDYAELTFVYGKSRVIVSASRMVIAARPRFSLHGTAASFVKHGVDPQEPALKAGGQPGEHQEDPATFGTLTRGDGSREAVPTKKGDYRAFYAEVATAITTGIAPPVTAEEALLGLRIMELAQQSAREGRQIGL